MTSDLNKKTIEIHGEESLEFIIQALTSSYKSDGFNRISLIENRIVLSKFIPFDEREYLEKEELQRENENLKQELKKIRDLLSFSYLLSLKEDFHEVRKSMQETMHWKGINKKI